MNHLVKKEKRVTGIKSISDIPALPLLISLFLTSASLLIFQVTLTRVFSPMLRYHFVFLVTSTAIFGLGMGGYVGYRLGRKTPAAQMAARLPGWLMLLAAAYIFSFSLIYKLPFINFYLIYSVIAALPFAVGGLFMSIIFMARSERSYRLYFADLLGAGVGSATVVVFINQFGIANTVLVIAGFAVLAAILMAACLFDKKQLVLHIAVVIIFVLVGAFQQGIDQFEKRFTGYFTSPLTSLARFRSTNSDHSIEDWNWDSFSRTDVIESRSYPRSKIISIDGGSNSEMIQFDGDLNKVRHLKSELEYLPFLLGASDRTLLIGPGGGKDILMALLAGSKDIQAAEINGGTVEIVRKYEAFNGGIYDLEEVTLHIQDGRNFVKQAREKYDLIYLALVITEVAESVGFALAENFIYTKEAIIDYWNALKDNGRLAFILHDEHDLKRLLFTLLKSFEEIGIPETELSKHVIVINRSNQANVSGKIYMPLVIIQKNPFLTKELIKLKIFLKDDRYIPLYIPDTTYNSFWKKLQAEASSPTGRFLRGSKVDFSPTTDDRPFFFDFDRGVDPILLILLGAALLIGLLFFVPAFKKNNLKRTPYYFLGLGVGFMLIEIPLIQKFTLFLGHPTRSFIVTLVAILSGGGLGSLVGGWKRFRWNRRYLPLIMVPSLILVVYVVFQILMSRWILSSQAWKVFIAFVLVFPLGFFLGMPFPFGIRTLHQVKKNHLVPLMWGLNGTMSIGGSALAVIISMKFGFSYSLAAGGLIYLVLFLLMPLFEKNWQVPA